MCNTVPIIIKTREPYFIDMTAGLVANNKKKQNSLPCCNKNVCSLKKSFHWLHINKEKYG